MQSKLDELVIVTGSKDENVFLKEKAKVYTFLNPVSYLNAIDNKQLYLTFDGIFADGSILVSAIALLYGKKIKRRSFDMTSMAPVIFNYAQHNGESVYIVASKQEKVEKAVKIIEEMYPGIKIIGYRNGYFSTDNEQDEEIRHIIDINPDYLIVGMGAIKQERFLLNVKHAGFKGIGFTCGGFIHQTSKNEINYYPAWVDKYNVRFLYRMYREPHTRMRYLKAGVLFPIRFAWERFSG
jgi:N-acetylglucosaminyldiphosphoundecaprenol N-acetyl-beta-D-mannosaminyltransferase